MYIICMKLRVSESLDSSFVKLKLVFFSGLEAKKKDASLRLVI